MSINFQTLGIDYLLVNSTNEFLTEYSNLSENSRYTITNFSGSTGDVLMTKNGEIFLFVDGRYHIQAEQEIFPQITLIKLQNNQKQDEEILKLIPEGATLGIISKKVSQARLETFKNVKIELLTTDPINNHTEINHNKIEILPLNLCGKTFEEKIKNLPKPYFTSNLEVVSYILNARDFSNNYSSKIQA